MDNEEMNLAELLKQTAEENQTRKISPAPKCFYYHSRKIEEFQEVKNDERKKRRI